MAVLDDDSKAALASGRRTLRDLWRVARSNLQRIVVAFLVGFLGSFYLLQFYLWDRLQADLFAQLPPAVREGTSVIALTPFDVVLLQAKIGLFAGGLVALPVVLYYGRESLAARGLWPDLPRRTLVGVGGLALVLFAGGVAYSYLLFFPLMFSFLASYSVQVGFSPTYSIVAWAEFVFLLSLSFGLAAQLPLAMLGLAYTEIVPYRTFREKWRHAVVAIFVFGAVFSPPDPFTQLMWAIPLLVLYGFSLGLTRVVVTVRDGHGRVDLRGALRASAPRVLGGSGAAALALVGALALGAAATVDRLLVALRNDPSLPVALPVPPGGLPGPDLLTGLPRPLALLAVGLATFLVLGVVGSVVVTYRALVGATGGSAEGDVEGVNGEVVGADGADAVLGDLDLAALDVDGLRVAPTALFADLSPEQALALAKGARAEGDPARARLIVERYDDARAATETAEAAEAAGTAGAAETSGSTEAAGSAGSGGTTPDVDVDVDPVGESETGTGAGNGAGASAPAAGAGITDTIGRTAADMATAFRDEEVTEEDVGGYLYDLQFVVESLTSRTFRIVAVFVGALAAAFTLFYQGGVQTAKEDFLSRLPASVAPADIDIVELHPVETLVFGVKLSTLLAAVVTLPVVAYYAWPALKERGLARGDRRVLLVWGATLLAGLAGGVALGYAVVAPAVISWLAADAVRAEMLVSYRINAFGWLVFFTTVGVGLLATIPASMLLFHFGRIVGYRSMRARWREVTVLVLVLSSGLMPGGVFTMFLLTVPTMVAYGVGLGVLWVVTLGGRIGARRSLGAADGTGDADR